MNIITMITTTSTRMPLSQKLNRTFPKITQTKQKYVPSLLQGNVSKKLHFGNFIHISQNILSPQFEMEETVTLEYNWLCSRNFLSNLTIRVVIVQTYKVYFCVIQKVCLSNILLTMILTSLAMSGILFGAITSGVLADKIGC